MQPLPSPHILVQALTSLPFLVHWECYPFTYPTQQQQLETLLVATVALLTSLHLTIQLTLDRRGQEQPEALLL